MPPKGTKAKAKASAIPRPKKVVPEPAKVQDNPPGVSKDNPEAPTKKPTARSMSRGASEMSGVQTRSKSRAGSTTSTVEVRRTLKETRAPPDEEGPAEQPSGGARGGDTVPGGEVSLSSPPIPGTFETRRTQSVSRAGSVESFDEMYAQPEELAPQDSVSNLPETPTEAPRTSARRAAVETIQEEDGSEYLNTYPKVSAIQSAINSVFATIRMQQEEIEDMRVTRALEEAELRELRQEQVKEIKWIRDEEQKELKRRRRDEEERYHQLVQTLLQTQQQMITLASTQGLEVPEVRDLRLTSSPSREPTTTPPTTTRSRSTSSHDGIGHPSNSSHQEGEKVTAKEGSRNEATTPDSEWTGETKGHYGPDTQARLDKAKLPQQGDDAREFVKRRMGQKWSPGGDRVRWSQEEADNLSRPGGRWPHHSDRARREDRREPPPLQEVQEGRPRRRTTVAPEGDPGDSSSSSEDDQGQGPRGPTNDQPRRRRRAQDSSEESQDDLGPNSASRPPRPYTGHQSAAWRGENPRYLRPVSGPGGPGGVSRTWRARNEDAPEPYAYENGLRKWIEEVLEQDLDYTPDDLPVLNKNIKVNMPSAYEGQDDVETFCDWVIEVTRFFQLTRLVGRQLDSQRVMVMGDMLGKEAARWYNTEVRAPERVQRRWTMKGIMFALQERFVHEATAQLASEKYETVKYSHSTGVAGLANDLRKYAGRMVEPPDGYSMRRKFINELPTTIVAPMVRNLNVTAENSTFPQMVREALAIENANRALEIHQKRQGRRTESASNNKGDKVTTGTALPRRRFTPRAPTEGTNNARTGVAPASAGTSNAVAGPSSASRAFRRNDTQARTAGKGVERSTTIQCYGCGGIGHVRSSPECPMNKGRGLRRMEEEGIEAEGPDEMDQETPLLEVEQGLAAIDMDEEYEGPLEGDQYDEEYPPEAYDEYDYETAEESFQAMRVVVGEPPEQVRLHAMAEAKGQRAAMRVTSQAKPRPQIRVPCVLIEGMVNGLKGKILLDSGSTINAMSPSFAAVAKVTAFPLECPVGLQLGCVGSRSKINFGISTKITVGKREHDMYFDVVNLDHFDMILGMPFLQQEGVVVEFASKTVRVGQQLVPTLRGEGTQEDNRKKQLAKPKVTNDRGKGSE